LINNRQNGRRRGRGGQQARNGQPGAPNNGSRLDNRARGNASQLLEKYRNLARDAQMSGDRVNTEYYLQFADHYFRVLNENRARFEEQRAQRGGEYRDEFGADDEAGETSQGRSDQGGDDNWDDNEGDAPPPRAARQSRNGGDHERGEGRRERGRRTATAPAPESSTAGENREEPNGFLPDFMSQRIEAQPAEASQPVEAAAEEPVEEAPKPRRRTRRPRAEAPVEADA
jgi:hypothetical protein